MSGDLTPRDVVWSAVVKSHSVRFDVDKLKREIRRNDREVPNDETIKRVLRSATELGVLEHTSGSPYWEKRSHIRKRWPVD